MTVDEVRESLMMTLHDIGFKEKEIETYMELHLADEFTKEERFEMLNRKRNCILDEIHFREKQLDKVDYLRYKIKKEMEEK